MRELDIYQVDAFTDMVFGGNPAGVVPDATGLSDEIMQKIAREMALSETAFIIDTRGKVPSAADFEVRFFTPWNEVDLCGHATIGSFWLLAELGAIRAAEGETRVVQKTKAGLLPVDIVAGCDGTPSRVMMTQNLPAVVARLAYDEVVELEGILGAPVGCVTAFKNPANQRSVLPQVISTGLPDLIVPVTSREALFSMRPNMAALIDFCNARKVISVHCFSLETLDPAATVHCRDFSPAVGVPEESATGTASGATGCYLVQNGLVDVEEPLTKMACEQGNILKRPSIIHVEIGSGAGQITSVRVGGSAATCIKGKLRIP